MKSQYVLPITIVIAGALIAGGVFLAGRSAVPTGPTDGQASDIRPYTPGQDYILGNPNAAVKVIEYMDMECPHCKLFHTTMHRVMDYYGASGNVAWVVRNFPLAQIHSKAPQEAQAAECAGEQGGSTAFFAFVDKVFEITPSSNGLDLAQLPVIAGQIGLNVETFNSCLSSGKFAEKVQGTYTEAIAAGAQGTPYTFITVNNELVQGGNLGGAQPYDSMRAIIDTVLNQLGTPATPPAQTSTTTQQ